MQICAMIFSLVLFSVTMPCLAQAAPAESPKSESPPAKTDAAKPKLSEGGVEILSDTQGVDFKPWLKRWHKETEKTWKPLIPSDVNPPELLKGMLVIRFKVLPNGRLMDRSLVLEGRSGDTALDKAAWFALTGSNYPPLPKVFRGPYLEMRAIFLYNMQPTH